jgi:pimeloyl-ACP methyl ester carboxylesterase
MIRRILFALAATASIPLILNPTPAPAATAHHAAAAATAIQLPHISVEVMGKGSPVILIPGLSSPRAVWDGVAPELAKTHRVYLVQVNGFGGDDPRDNIKPGVLAGIVEDIHALIAQEKLKHAAVVGHSMGGLAGLMLAKAHPEDVARLMVVDSLPYIGTLFAPNATVAAIEPQAAAIRDQMLASYGKPANAAAAEATANRLALKPESRAKVSAWVQASDARVTGLALYEDMTTDLRPDLASIATPVTLVYPWSAAVPKERADALYRGEYAKAPHVTFVDVGDAAHFVMLDQPEAFRAALAAFLAS